MVGRRQIDVLIDDINAHEQMCDKAALIRPMGWRRPKVWNAAMRVGSRKVVATSGQRDRCKNLGDVMKKKGVRIGIGLRDRIGSACVVDREFAIARANGGQRAPIVANLCPGRRYQRTSKWCEKARSTKDALYRQCANEQKALIERQHALAFPTAP